MEHRGARVTDKIVRDLIDRHQTYRGEIMKRFIYFAMIMAIFVLVAGVALPAQAEDVGALYKAKCASCHGADGKGDTAMGKKFAVRSFSGPEVAKMKDAELIEITTKGKDKMPAYENKLTADQIKDLVKFLRALK
jgi:mono/diheme cytochrome c family protein